MQYHEYLTYTSVHVIHLLYIQFVDQDRLERCELFLRKLDHGYRNIYLVTAIDFS